MTKTFGQVVLLCCRGRRLMDVRPDAPYWSSQSAVGGVPAAGGSDGRCRNLHAGHRGVAGGTGAVAEPS